MISRTSARRRRRKRVTNYPAIASESQNGG
jgi:hypothetical protein